MIRRFCLANIRALAPAALCGMVAVACGDDGVTGSTVTPVEMTILTGQDQVWFPEQQLPTKIRVVGVDDRGGAVSTAGIPVQWEVLTGGGQAVGDAVTDEMGEATARWVLGPSLGSQTLVVRMGELPTADVHARAVEPGPITFARIDPRNGSTQGIHVVDPDGSNAIAVTSGDGEYPDWSPDGSAIVFTREAAGNTWQLFTLSTSDWTVRQITSTPAPDSRGLLHMYPSFSPDGQRITYHVKTSHPSCGAVTWTQIFVANADGTDPVQLTDGCGLAHSRPRFSPGGNRIVYRSLEGTAPSSGAGWSIWIMGVDGSNPTRITDLDTHQSDPVWSPDGTRIYYIEGEREIWSVQPDGEDRQLVHEVPADLILLGGVSPEDNRLLLDTYDYDAEVWSSAMLDIDTGALATLAAHAIFSRWRRNGRSD